MAPSHRATAKLAEYRYSIELVVVPPLEPPVPLPELSPLVVRMTRSLMLSAQITWPPKRARP